MIVLAALTIIVKIRTRVAGRHKVGDRSLLIFGTGVVNATLAWYSGWRGRGVHSIILEASWQTGVDGQMDRLHRAHGAQVRSRNPIEAV